MLCLYQVSADYSYQQSKLYRIVNWTLKYWLRSRDFYLLGYSCMASKQNLVVNCWFYLRKFLQSVADFSHIHFLAFKYKLLRIMSVKIVANKIINHLNKSFYRFKPLSAYTEWLNNTLLTMFTLSRERSISSNLTVVLLYGTTTTFSHFLCLYV